MEQPPFSVGAQPAPLDPPPPLPLEADQAAVMQALSRHERAASEHLAGLEAAVDALIRQTHQRSRRIVRVVSGAVAAFLAVMIGTSCLGSLASGLFACGFFACMLAAGVGFLCWSVYTRDRLSSRSEQAALALAQVNDRRAAGPLIETLRLPSDYDHRTSIDALIRLLPQIGPDDAEILNASRCALLWNLLSRPAPVGGSVCESSQTRHDREIDLRVAVLQAFTQAGSSRVTVGVAQLAQEKAQTPGEQRIRQAAQVCLTALRARAGQQYSNQTLLRPSDASAAAPHILLRPAAGAPETSPDQLLRPDSSHRT